MRTKGRFVLYGLLVMVFAAFAQAQSCVPPPSGIISWWPGDGNALDFIGNNHGILFGGTGFTTGLVGQAFNLNGNGGVRVSHNQSLAPLASLTIEGWVRPAGAQRQWARIFQKSFPTGYYYYVSYLLGINGGGTSIPPSFSIAVGGSHHAAGSSISLPLNAFSYIAGTYNGSIINIYVNGMLQGSSQVNGLIQYDNGNAYIGYNDIYTSENWLGQIDEITLYSRALTQEEILTIHAAGPAGKCKTIFIITHILPSGILSQFSSDQFIAVGGAPPYLWSLVNGTIPSEMNLYHDGILNGTPTNAGNFTFTVRVTDANNSVAEKTFTKEIFVTLPPPQLRIHKTGTTAVPGRILDYFITVENIGNFPAQSVTVDEYLDTSLFNLTSANPPARVEGNESYPINIVSWDIPTLAPLETKVFSYRAKLNASTPIGTEVVGGPVVVNALAPPSNQTGQGSWRPLPLPSQGYNIVSGFDCVLPGRDAHKAVDVQAAIGTSVTAIAPGEVVHADEFGNRWFGGPPFLTPCRGLRLYGKTVIIKHDNNEYSLYAHLSSILVQQNQRVATGQLIGYTGISGAGGCWGRFSIGPHLHFGYFRGGILDGNGVNPCSSLDRIANPESCSCAGGGDSDEHTQTATRPVDPNEKEVVANRFIKSDQTLVYPIHFENIGNVSALDVFVDDTLDRNFNLSTVRLLSPNGTFNPQTGLVRWELYGINLQPNATGVVMFSVKPRQGLSSGTRIRNNATIQFEIFERITTNAVENIIDDVAPLCTMNSLPPVSVPKNFTISWNSTDSVGEVASTTVFTSVDRGPFNTIIINTQATNATFTGERGRVYDFICIATDTAGNIEVQAPVPEATVQTAGPQLTLQGIPRIGTTVNLSVSDLLYPSRKYVLAMSLGTTPGILLGDGRVIPLNPDIIFLVSLQAPQWIGLRNNIMLLNSQGLSTVLWDIPNIPALINQTVFAAFIIVDHQQQTPIASISNAVSMTMQQ